MRVRHTIISLALIAAIAFVVPALGDSGASREPSAATPAKAIKKAKKALKLAKRNQKAIKSISLTPGPQGEKGEQGPQGEQGQQGPAGDPATRLFAFVRSDGTLMYGSGATSANRSSAGRYTVVFNRDLGSCVPMAVAGEPVLVGDGSVLNNPAIIATIFVPDDRVTVSTNQANTNSAADSAFFLAVLC